MGHADGFRRCWFFRSWSGDHQRQRLPDDGNYTDDLIDFNPRASGDIINVNNFFLAGNHSDTQLEIVAVNGYHALALVGGSGGGAPSKGIQGVPEPSTLALLAAGAMGLLMYAWRKKRS